MQTFSREEDYEEEQSEKTLALRAASFSEAAKIIVERKNKTLHFYLH